MTVKTKDEHRNSTLELKMRNDAKPEIYVYISHWKAPLIDMSDSMDEMRPLNDHDNAIVPIGSF